MTPRTLRRILNLWPPFLFAGIRVTAFSDDFRHARVELRMRPWNRNDVGTHFGGSLFAMTDPFWMIMVKESLGRDYFIWDRAAEIAFLKPGRGTVSRASTWMRRRCRNCARPRPAAARCCAGSRPT